MYFKLRKKNHNPTFLYQFCHYLSLAVCFYFHSTYRASHWQENAWPAWCSHPDTVHAGGAQPDPVCWVTTTHAAEQGHTHWSWAGRDCCGRHHAASPALGLRTEPLWAKKKKKKDKSRQRKPQPTQHMASGRWYKHIQSRAAILLSPVNVHFVLYKVLSDFISTYQALMQQHLDWKIHLPPICWPLAQTVKE